MDKSDIIESLKQKEIELDELLDGARKKALQIKQDALHKVGEIKLSMSKEIEEMLDEYKKNEGEKINKEVEVIKDEAIKEVQRLRHGAEDKLDEAVWMAVGYILNPEGYKK